MIKGINSISLLLKTTLESDLRKQSAICLRDNAIDGKETQK